MLQFGTFSSWAYPLNFLTFAAVTSGALPARACADYWPRYGRHGDAVRAVCRELEDVMRGVVRYGDIRRPPRQPAAAARILPGVEAALPQLAALTQRLETLAAGEPTVVALAGLAALLRYTHAVLDAVRYDLRETVAGRAASANHRYAEALPVIETVDRRFKGVWGTVDLPLIHSYFAALSDWGNDTSGQ